MLEGLVAWVLNNYLGKYVENLNTDQLSIALLSGQVELENLPLKKDALRHLGLPIEIEAGFIGKIILQIPVRQIRSAPWVIIIDQLYVVASPLSVQEWDSKLEHLTVHEQKLSALDALEAQWRLEMESKDNSAYYYASTYSSWLNYGTGLITDIIENLQLKIHDVHIRYEDCFSITNKTVAFGVTMESLSAQSCDSNWVPEFTHWHSSAASFKLIDMQKLAVYWITLEQGQNYSNIDMADLKALLSQIKNSSFNQHYILEPVSAQAHLKHNRSEKPLRSLSTPRIVCDLQMDEVALSLVDWQYEQIIKCVNGLDDIARLRKFRLYRPECSVKEDAKSWWLYAVCCNFSDKLPSFCKPKPTWNSCLQRAKENVAYVKLYVDILSTPTMALTPDNKKLKDAVEWDRDYNELKVLREIAMRKVPAASLNTNTTNSAGRGILVRWFPTWMGWYSSNSNLGTTVSLDHPPSQLEGEILEALSDSIANNTLLKRDMVFGQFNFTLNSGTLNLCTTGDNGNSSVPMIEFQFKNLSLKVTSCPRTSSHTLELSLGAIYLRDKLTEHSLFPILVGPPDQERVIQLTRTKGSNPKLSARGGGEERSEPLFSLLYEKRSENSGCDYKLSVKSKSLDVVYQPLAIKWLVEFACHPHQTIITQSSIEAMKTRTKKELIKNWEQIIDGRLSSRKSWELNLDISTPQIIFVEKFTDPNSAVAIVDFGKLHLQNTTNVGKNDINDLTKKDSEDDEMFMTPCSTPPGSEEDNSETLTSGVTPQQQQILDDVLNEQSLHQKLYESYAVELTDLQVLISKAKDNWRYAHNKGTSPLHVLDRFNISMQIERCIVHTCDPLYPSLTVNANLPKLVAHVNEQKVAAAKSLVDSVSIAGFPSPFSTPENIDLENTIFSDEDESSSLDMSLEMSRLLIFQFSIDQLALEVQSRGRSIAELQVAGVRASFSRRPVDISINLSVHSLLLVDALQTFGPDFELLVASHKHVGMDSMSGSLRDSEPTSPTSPASPDPGHVSSMSITSPLAITQALSNLTSSPPHSFVPSPLPRLTTALDSEALITVEIVLITGLEPMHIANIQFNNLDIIANQETIVELMGFTHRVFPDINNKKYTGLQVRRPEVTASTDTIDAPDELTPSSNIRRTEITFDFHRLNVLLLRGVVKDGCLIGKKIATASMCEARIQATVDKGVLVEGSLGGLQMVDLTSEGQIHQRIVSVGHDPLSETPHPMYLMSQANQDKVHKAFSFKIKRDVKSSENDIADISIRMASVWYTHSPTFIGEFQSCATEFKQYFANLARSIRAAATDMALGLVQSKTEALAQSLYINSRLSSSLYGSAMSFSDALTPRKRFRRSSSNQDPSEGVTGYFSARDTVDQTPYSPEDDEDIVINIKLDVVLDSPVVILPRSSNSPEVFVAHLGKISVTNRNETPENGKWNIRTEYYNVEVRDMNLYSLDTSSRRTPGPIMSKVDTLYACDSLAKPILYDTILQLNIEREVNIDPQCRHRSLSNLLEEDYQTDCQPYDDVAVLENIQISGTFVTSLKLSLTRTQYEQLLATLQFLTTSFNLNNTEETPRASSRNVSSLADICEEDTGVTTLKMDPHVRAKMFTAAPSLKSKTSKKRLVTLKILFDLPLFTIELRGDSPTGEQGLVDLSFRDFVLNYEKCHPYETNIQVSLRSVTMEDLLQAQESKQRVMVISSDGGLPCKPSCVSRSCPEGFGYFPTQSMSHCSLPDHLEPAKVLGVDMLSKISRHAEKRVNGCPDTPPPSPSAKERPQKNLVLISTLLVDPSAPNFKTHYNSVERSTSVDFNCLDLVVNVESWVIVIDFFSVTPSDYKQAHRKDEESKAFTKNIVEKENEETNISIRSLNVVLVKPQSDLAKVNISHVEVCIKTDGIQKEVKGHLGSMSLLDLTLHGQLYKERFLTSGKQALLFIYTRFSPNKVLNFDAQLKLEMSSVSYVHTKRFVAELQAFFNRFTHLQAVMQSIRTATSRQQNTNEIKKLSVILEAEAPVLYLPVSSKSSDLLIADLGHLIVTNDFKYSDNEGVISVVKNKEAGKKCLLDIMFIELQNVDLFTGVRETSSSKTKTINDTHVILGSSVIRRNGASLLKNKCHLKIQVERNLFSDIYHTVPDMSIQGELSTLDITVDVQQYKLIKGLLFYNLGECTEHILPSVSKSNLEVIKPSENVWTLLSIKFNLMNVVLDLHTNYKSEPIARVNFIKSQLTVESFSNFSQDVDLVSQEIVVIDTRSQNENSNKQNVFTNILQSIVFNCQDDLVQLEVHSRKKQDKTKFTILLNNMRLMTIFDWWESAAKFIFANYEEEQPTSPTHESSSLKNEKGSFELKLNITDSEIVMVQDISQWDTNAVILKVFRKIIFTLMFDFHIHYKDNYFSRDAQGRIYFLRMEVVLEGATFFVIFADADTMPPPIRVDNFSEVPLTFWQTCCKDLLRCNVRAHTSIPYAWDEPTGSSFLTVSAPGGVSNNYDMNKIGNVPQLTYENFIYIAFAGTFKDGEDVLNDPMDVENQQLVLDVVNSKQVILNRKIPGQRSQLWRMTASGQLQHEGSSPPSHPQQPRSDNVLVLDIEGPAPQPNTYNRLMLRKPDSRRRSTQTWRFTDDGRLCCAHYKMCVQAQDGFFGLRPGNAAILGLPQPICHRTTETGIPLEQAVTRQRLRPGSGVLSVEISTDGPTRVLNIRDMHEKSVYAVPDEREWNKIVKKQRPKFTRYSNQDDDDAKKTEYQCTLKLAGVGISVVTRKPFEELLYAKFETIVGETVITKIARTFCISVRDIQVDNQLLDTTVPVLLYVTPPKTNRNDDEYYKLPALDISTEIQPTPNENAVIFKHLIVNLKKLTINLEEKFILKLLSFIEIGSKEEETIPDSTSEYDYDMQRMLSEVSASYAKRYYFGVIHLVPNQIKLSMKTASKLPPELKAVKRKWDIPFIKFEDALVDLKPFVRRHPFETAQFLLNSIKKHFKDELIWQAAIILGSVDVLGNPVGFMNDVSEGVSGFFTEGSVRTLVKNVTHGLSNSAAKVTESISDGLGRVTMDDEHEEMRQRIRQVEPGKSGDHLLAGIKGLSFGILGGATSIFKHVYEGAANEGIQGVFSGLGKGLVGTVTKPVVGVLDLASETARAVRETSRSRISPDRSRLPRCVWGTGGLLPPYSKKQSKAQQLLYTVSDRNFSEHLVAFERLNSEDLKILVSNQKIWIVGLNTVQLEVYLSDLQQCQPVTVSEGSDSRYYIEITMKVSNANSTALYQDAIKRPIIRCDSYDLARWVSQQVNYAKRLYDERLHTLTSDVLQVEE
ncbi:vacuolar protein sorting-associated protein 13D [Agrilus planipennis]|uniref:Vacuolar protein sorting-associated protein 13D n=1 Tax=Agrilus planipennis TaxID=224129 RepID=A0A7F5RK15_AGRPL|nr:vacuolar protein sorting-associated protein 13D [Agrilus planipennis]